MPPRRIEHNGIRRISQRITRVMAPFDSTGPVPRNQQYLGLLLMLLVILASIAVSLASLSPVNSTAPKSRLLRHYSAWFAVLVLLECIYWSWRMDNSPVTSRPAWRTLKWRLSQDLCGFLCCSEIPNYKRNHIQNHVLYGTVFVATLSSWYYVWLCTEVVLLDYCQHLDSHVITIDILYHLSIICHTWLQIMIIFMHRRGTINADDGKLLGIVLTISLNFAIYFHVVFSKKGSSMDYDDPLVCSPSTGKLIQSLQHEHSFWIQPIGAALTVEFVVTINTVLFSLWYHAKLKKKTSTKHNRAKTLDNRRVPESYQGNHFGPDQANGHTECRGFSHRRRYRIEDVNETDQAAVKWTHPSVSSLITLSPIPRRWSDTPKQDSLTSITSCTNTDASSLASTPPSTHATVRRSITSGPMLMADHSIKIRKNPWNLPWAGLLVGIFVFLPLFVTSFLGYVDCSYVLKIENVLKNDSNLTNSTVYSISSTVCSLVAIILILVSMGILSLMRPLKCLQVHEKIDITVLFITIVGILTVFTFSMTAVAYQWPREIPNLKVTAGTESIVLALHAILQTIMITKSYATQSTRRDAVTCKLLYWDVSRKQLGKLLTEIYIILFIFNITQWFTGAFHEHQDCSLVQNLNSRFYPESLWGSISRLVNPLSLSYYFNSCICYVALISRFASEYKKPRFMTKQSNVRVYNGNTSVAVI